MLMMVVEEEAMGGDGGCFGGWRVADGGFCEHEGSDHGIVVKAVKSLTGLGLKDAKELVDAAPGPVKEGISQEEAEAMKVAFPPSLAHSMRGTDIGRATTRWHWRRPGRRLS
eukprot:3709366-Rhodomonas_salina.1